MVTWQTARWSQRDIEHSLNYLDITFSQNNTMEIINVRERNGEGGKERGREREP